TSLKVSLDGSCGGQTGQTCLGSTFGDCCSAYGWCGSTDLYCQATEGCQLGFGECIAPSPVSSSALPTSTVKVSTDGTCGGDSGFVCTGSGFGDCCSPYGWCGSGSGHCGAGCQTPFGTCNSSPTTLATVTGTAPQPSSTLKVSLNGECGGTTGQTCLGSDFGNCCSEYGYCGSTEIYCSTGCQLVFGTCA
ncbi:carbohydrate-binding module family 18 protein, partial [Zopfia rhizophila CBS 207.26]